MTSMVFNKFDFSYKTLTYSIILLILLLFSGFDSWKLLSRDSRSILLDSHDLSSLVRGLSMEKIIFPEDVFEDASCL